MNSLSEGLTRAHEDLLRQPRIEYCPKVRTSRLYYARRFTIALLLVPMLGIVGCGDEETSLRVQRYEGENFSLEVPSRWRTDERNLDGPGQGVLFLSPDPVGNPRALPNEVFVFLPEATYASVEAYIDSEYDFAEITVRNRQPVDLPGAIEAVRFETEGKTAPPETIIRQVFVIARGPGGTVTDLVCRGAAEDFDLVICNDILDSLALASS